MANYYRVSQDCQEGLYEAVQLPYVIVQVYCSYKGYMCHIKSHWSPPFKQALSEACSCRSFTKQKKVAEHLMHACSDCVLEFQAVRCPFLLAVFYSGTSDGRGYLYRFQRVLPACRSTYRATLPREVTHRDRPQKLRRGPPSFLIGVTFCSSIPDRVVSTQRATTRADGWKISRQAAAIGRPAIRKVGTLGADFGSVGIALGKRPTCND
eukprot:COSAG01_NODE_3515_length_5982_cov_4.429883_3_plen_209_part_00